MRILIRLIPPFLVRFFARPYVAGDSLAAGLAAASRLWRERGILSTLDLLAEDIHEEAQARRNLETYLEMVDAVAAEPGIPEAARPTLSMKASSYTTHPMHKGGDARGALEAIERIAERAAEKGVGLTLDMESHHWTDFTLRALHQLHGKGHRHVGCVLQARLHRTEQDLEQIPEGIRVRLVIGIYQEPAAIALTGKREMKRRMLDHAGRLLRRGHYVEFATHDEGCVREFVDAVAPQAGADPARFEVQMLYGVPRDKLLAELLERGIRCRLYVPFALSWGLAVQYLRRRLDEFPAMMWLVTRNLFRRR
ncbi:MAG: proline dehydrogenase [Planctomycetota bacterium]